MKLLFSFFVLTLLNSGSNLKAQTFEGTWKGTSLCQVKNSPCHDETVVFYITKDNTGKKYDVNGYKVVNGAEDFMGLIIFHQEEKRDTYVSEDNDRDAKWEFKVTGNSIKGTLAVRGTLFRLVDLKKSE